MKLKVAVLSLICAPVFADPSAFVAPTVTATANLSGSVGTGAYVTSGVSGSVTQISDASLTNVVGIQSASGVVSASGINALPVDVNVGGLTTATQTVASASSQTVAFGGTYNTIATFADGVNAYSVGASQVNYTAKPTITVVQPPAPVFNGSDNGNSGDHSHD